MVKKSESSWPRRVQLEDSWVLKIVHAIIDHMSKIGDYHLVNQQRRKAKKIYYLHPKQFFYKTDHKYHAADR